MRRKGFTLIEVLAVITIIGLLMAIIFPVFAAARHNARMTVCASNLHQLDLALRMYQQDWNGKMPLGGPLDSYQCPWFDDPLRPYTHNGDIDHCPEADYSHGKPCNDYIYRGALILPGADDTPHLVARLEPDSVLLYCTHHVRYQEFGPGKDGQFLVLRASGKIERIDSRCVADWGYQDGHWLPPGKAVVRGGDEAELFDVFPDEPWPPPLER